MLKSIRCLTELSSWDRPSLQEQSCGNWLQSTLFAEYSRSPTENLAAGRTLRLHQLS